MAAAPGQWQGVNDIDSLLLTTSPIQRPRRFSGKKV
jgi:hypothetical protein